ncbi:LOW QUALITY PROTEIN: hypothetical protein U9M48_041775 [Paspalum notatum var. saurae]|uniref:VWFA domain-containing protein n=1 Tax=Paspalum notatum var. saurae TaxID=547442 RepID=A0AAQ3UR84_PASNO
MALRVAAAGGVSLPACLTCSLLLLALVMGTAAGGEIVKVSTTPVFPAIPRDQQRDDFEVLVRVEAPAAAKRSAPIDLVAVLDHECPAVSPEGPSRLDLLKKAMKFIVKKLDDGDRLAIVAFNDQVVQEHSTDLLRISGDGRSHARRKVDGLKAGGRTAFLPALEQGKPFRRIPSGKPENFPFPILDERSADLNRVGFVLLLSDGIDNSGIKWSREAIVRKSLLSAMLSKYPVHTFGFSESHDPKALHFIAQESRGTYSFVKEHLDSITGAFAVCLGGLKTVVAVNTRVKLTAAEHGGVQIRSIKSGGYMSSISRDRTSSEIVLDVLYASEVKDFIVYLHVPPVDGASCGFDHHRRHHHHHEQHLLTLDAGYGSYYRYATGVKNSMSSVEASGHDVLYIQRPEVVSDAAAAQRQAPSPAVVSHIVRFELLEVVSKFIRHELDVVDQDSLEGGAVRTVDLGRRLEITWEEFKDRHKFWSGVDLGVLDSAMSAMASGLGDRARPLGAYVYSWVSSYQMQRATTMGSADRIVAEFITADMQVMLAEALEFHHESVVVKNAAGGDAADRPAAGAVEQAEELGVVAPLAADGDAEAADHLTAVVQEASLEVINRAMHHDMYLVRIYTYAQINPSGSRNNKLNKHQ